jgi:hypothetical protein
VEPRVLARVGHGGRGLARLGEDVHEHVDQHRLRDRLHEEAVELEALRVLADLLASERRDEHDRGRMGEGRVAADLPARREPVEPRHLPVHEDEVVGFARVALLHRGDRLLARPDLVDLQDDLLQRLLQHLARGRIVVRDQHAQFREPLRQHLARARLSDAEPRREVEGAALSGRALDPDPAAHELDEAAADGEAEPGAAVLARGRHVGLREGLEELRRLLR